MKKPWQTLGVKLAFVTALISGLANFINKLAVTGIQPLVHTTLKNLMVFLLIAGVGLLVSRWQELKDLSKRDWVRLVLIGLIGGSLPFYLFFTALANMPAINAALIHKTLVIWVAILARPWLKERLSVVQMVGIGLLFLSNLVIGGFSGWAFSQWELMVLAATLLWALENVLAKVTLKTVSPLVVAGARMGFGSVVLLAATVASGQAAVAGSLSLQQWGLVALTAAFLFGYVTTWYAALKRAPAVVVAGVLVLATVVTNVMSAIFVTHAFSLEQFYQAMLVIAGVAAVIWAGRQVKAGSSTKPQTI